MRITVAAGTCTAPGGQLALNATCRHLASLDADVTVAIPRSVSLTQLPPGPRYVPMSKPRAIIAELFSKPGVDQYIGMADRLPLFRRPSRSILVVQNPHLYGAPTPGLTLIQRLKTQLRRLWMLHSLPRADTVVVATRAMAAEVCAIPRVSPDRITVRSIPPVDIDRCRSDHRGVIGAIVLIGEARSYKRFDWAVREIDRWAAESRRHPAVRHVGRVGHSRGGLDLIDASRSCTHAVVELLGALSHRETIKILSEADVFVFPSSRESFGIPLAEALALGVPAICSDLPQFQEIGGDAPVYVNGDVGTIVHALATLDGREERCKRGRAGVAWSAVNSQWDLLSTDGALPADVRSQEPRKGESGSTTASGP